MLILFKHKSRIKVTTIIILLSFLFFSHEISAGPVKKHTFKIDKPNQFSSTISFNNNSEHMWFDSLSAKIIKDKELIPWNNDFSSHQERYFQSGDMGCKLYDGEFRRIDYIQQKMVEKAIPKIAEQIILDTRTGQKIDKLGKKISTFFKIAYLKNSNSKKTVLYLPGQKITKTIDSLKKNYGVSLCTHIFSNTEASPMKWAWELSSYFHETVAKTTYEPGDGELKLELTNNKLNQYIKAKTNMEFTADSSETKVFITFGIDF